VGAAVGRHALVVSADVCVVALELRVQDAQSCLAVVAQGASVSIIAGAVLVIEDARAVDTRLRRARVTVVTRQRRTADAASLATDVCRRAGVPIRARHIDGRVDAPLEGFADICGARVAVIAIDGPHRYADPLPAHVEVGARVSILAVGLVRREHAPDLRIAAVIGAAVLVVAHEGVSAHALSFHARVVQGARVAVAARPDCTLVGTAAVAQAAVYRARVSVVTGEGARTHTLTVAARVHDRAVVAVVTG